MFRRYEVVFVFSNAVEPYKKYYNCFNALKAAYDINRGRNTLGLYDVACVRQIGHFPRHRRSGL